MGGHECERGALRIHELNDALTARDLHWSIEHTRTMHRGPSERAIEIGHAATLETVIQSGLRGRGGAGFPAGIKWKSAAEATAGAKYIVCNADEGDSGTFADRMLMEGDPFSLIVRHSVA